jgi:hypothetical protein
MGWSSRNRLPNSQTAGYDRNNMRPKDTIAKDECGTTVLVPTAWRFELKRWGVDMAFLKHVPLNVKAMFSIVWALLI